MQRNTKETLVVEFEFEFEFICNAIPSSIIITSMHKKYKSMSKAMPKFVFGFGFSYVSSI